MKRKKLQVFFVLILGSMFWFPPGGARAAVNLMVTGKVSAIDKNSNPQTIVVSAYGAHRRKLTVGCRMEQDTVIRIGNRRAKLEELHSGDRVRLNYERVDDGLICEKIGKK